MQDTGVYVPNLVVGMTAEDDTLQICKCQLYGSHAREKKSTPQKPCLRQTRLSSSDGILLKWPTRHSSKCKGPRGLLHLRRRTPSRGMFNFSSWVPRTDRPLSLWQNDYCRSLSAWLSTQPHGERHPRLKTYQGMATHHKPHQGRHGMALVARTSAARRTSASKPPAKYPARSQPRRIPDPWSALEGRCLRSSQPTRSCFSTGAFVVSSIVTNRTAVTINAAWMMSDVPPWNVFRVFETWDTMSWPSGNVSGSNKRKWILAWLSSSKPFLSSYPWILTTPSSENALMPPTFTARLEWVRKSVTWTTALSTRGSIRAECIPSAVLSSAMSPAPQISLSTLVWLCVPLSRRRISFTRSCLTGVEESSPSRYVAPVWSKT